MLTNGNNANCGFADEIVSYIYDESGEPERRKFETHLAGCSVCTDEFAAISNARFSVFEWQKEEFAHLSTPQIVIPYTPAKSLAEDSSAGIFAGLRALLTFPTFGFAAAGIVVCLGLGFLGINYIDDRPVADVSVDEQIAPPANLPANLPVVPPPAEITAVDEPKIRRDTATKTVKDVPPSPSIQSARTSDNRRPKLNRPLTADTRKPLDKAVNPNSAQMRERPVLSNFDDNDDKSLRLTDLFEDGGAKR